MFTDERDEQRFLVAVEEIAKALKGINGQLTNIRGVGCKALEEIRDRLKGRTEGVDSNIRKS